MFAARHFGIQRAGRNLSLTMTNWTHLPETCALFFLTNPILASGAKLHDYRHTTQICKFLTLSLKSDAYMKLGMEREGRRLFLWVLNRSFDFGITFTM